MPEMNEAVVMKKIGRRMSLLMGITLSFFLSLTGTLSSGHFTPAGWLASFAVSTAISLAIGMVVPMKKVADGACGRLGLAPRTLAARCVESLVSDLVYTPLITLIMVALAYAQAAGHGARLAFLPMFLGSLGLCMAVGFVLIFIFMPVYMRLVLGSVRRPGQGGAPGGER